MLEHIDGLVNYWLRAQRTAYTCVAPAGADGGEGMVEGSLVTYTDARGIRSFEALYEAHGTPQARRLVAVGQMRLPLRMGGSGAPACEATATARSVASKLACFHRIRRWIPGLASLDPRTGGSAWCTELAKDYEDLRCRRLPIAAEYERYAQELLHYCDGETNRPRFRPRDLASAAALPPLGEMIDDPSIKTPAQRRLASIPHHEAWLDHMRRCVALDAAEAAAGSTLRPDREACRAIATAQPFASGLLSAKPVAWETRSDSAEYVWGLQRRVGLHLTAAAPTFAALSVNTQASRTTRLATGSSTTPKRTDRRHTTPLFASSTRWRSRPPPTWS